MALANYVKFLRGTTAAYKKLPQKDSDTLYFVSESKDSDSGKLYLGDKLIGIDAIDKSGKIKLNDIADIVADEGIAQNVLLAYDAATKTWTPKPIEEVLQEADLNLLEMVGATEEWGGRSGLVPIPKAGVQNLFLRGDATWADPVAKIKLDISSLSTQVNALDIVVSDLTSTVSQHLGDFSNIKIQLDSLKEEVTSLVAINEEFQKNTNEFKTQVGNLKLLFHHEEDSSLVDEVNFLSQQLTWQNLINT